MKKIFTTLAVGCLFGISGAVAQAQVAYNITGVADANTLVNVIEIKNAQLDNNASSTEWTSVNPSGFISVNSGSITQLIVNPTEEGYYLSGTFSPLQSSGVTIQMIDESNLVGYGPKGGKVGGLFVSLNNGFNGGLIIEGTSINITLNDGTPGSDQPVYNPIPVNFNIPSNATGLIQSLSFLGETTTIPADTNPDGYTIEFNRHAAESGAALLSISYRTDDAGNQIFNVGNVEASVVKEGSDVAVAATTTMLGNGCSILIPVDAVEVNVSFTISDPDKDYIEYTINVNDPKGITVTTNYDNIIELNGENNVIQATDYDIISISAKSGYNIVSVTNGSGVAISNYNRIDIKDGMVINVTVEEVEVVMASFTINLEADVFQRAYYTTDGLTQVELENLNGANVISFDPALGQRYQVVAIPIEEDAPLYVFVNAVSSGAALTTTVYFAQPSDGLEINAYVNKPESYQVTFLAMDNTYTEVEVTVDGDVLGSWSSASGSLILADSELKVYAPVNAEVKKNDMSQTSDVEENGKKIYTFAVTEDMNITISESAAVGSLKADDAQEVIYNLNGLRVEPSQLSKGLYIINGKKVLVK